MSQLLDQVAQGAKSISKSAQKGLEIMALKSKVTAIRGSMGKDYRMIGEMTFLAIQAGEEAAISDRVAELVTVVREKLAQIEEHENRILEINEEKICPQCQKTSPMEALFCQSCGTKFEVMPVEEEKEEDFEDSTYNCPSCGTTLSYGADFCTNCGTKVTR